LALTLADVGFVVIGIDKDKQRIEKLKKLEPPIYEPHIKQILESTTNSKHIEFSEEIPTFEENVVYIISVGTPIQSDTRDPMLGNYKNAVIEIAEKIKKGDLVIQRSTVPVGTARNVLKVILEENSNLKASVDFQLSCAPERTLQGKA
jgi:nucleotide sugar dehydrogenase